MEEEDSNFILSSTTPTQFGNSTQDPQGLECYIFKRSFRTKRGLIEYLNACRRKDNTAWNVDVNIDNQSAVVQEHLPQQDQECRKFYWNTVPGSVYQKGLERLFDQWTNDTPLKCIALKAIHVMQTLFLQKASRKTKAQNHLIALERRLKLWDEGNIKELLDKSKVM